MSEIIDTYPVDMAAQDFSEIQSDSKDHLACVTSSITLTPVRLSQGTEVKVVHGKIGRLALFEEGDDQPSLLALYSPEDETQVVAIYLHGKWWSICDVLKTSSKSRSGLILVESVMERIVLFLLSQIVFGKLERPLGENMFFSPHPLWEFGKIQWHDGEAVGFYTIKKKGSLCSGCTGQSYRLPVLDTVFVRSSHRRKGLGLRMLEDFCTSLRDEEELGISSPISFSMYEVCKKYLETHQEQRDRLYEVEAPGDWNQRRNVWLSIKLRQRQRIDDAPIQKSRYPQGTNSGQSSLTENDKQGNPDQHTEILSQNLDSNASPVSRTEVRDPLRGTGEKRPAEKEEREVNAKQTKVLI